MLEEDFRSNKLGDIEQDTTEKKDKTEKQIAQTSSTTYNTKVLTEKSREDI